MNIKQFIATFTLYIMTTISQPVKAGMWDWFKSPITTTASYIWSFCPITKAGLLAHENQQKNDTTTQVNRLCDQQNASKQTIDAQFDLINAKQKDAETILSLVQAKIKAQKDDSHKLQKQLTDLEKVHTLEKEKLDAELKDAASKLALMAVSRHILQETVHNIGMQANELDNQVGSMQQLAQENSQVIQDLINQSHERDERIRRIRELLKPKKSDCFAVSVPSKQNFNIEGLVQHKN